jgi:hypothetical protein
MIGLRLIIRKNSVFFSAAVLRRSEKQLAILSHLLFLSLLAKGGNREIILYLHRARITVRRAAYFKNNGL